MNTLTKTILSILAVVLAVVVIAVMIKIGVLNPKINEVPVTAQTPVGETSTVSEFAWRYEAGNISLDGLPKTIIYLDTTYQSGKVIPIKVEEVQGSCNAVDPVNEDSDMVAGTEKIQCYAAGFGEVYKIINGTDSYQIVRKHIEEGDPEVKPVDFKYETVASVPFSQ